MIPKLSDKSRTGVYLDADEDEFVLFVKAYRTAWRRRGRRKHADGDWVLRDEMLKSAVPHRWMEEEGAIWPLVLKQWRDRTPPRLLKRAFTRPIDWTRDGQRLTYRRIVQSIKSAPESALITDIELINSVAALSVYGDENQSLILSGEDLSLHVVVQISERGDEATVVVSGTPIARVRMHEDAWPDARHPILQGKLFYRFDDDGLVDLGALEIYP